MTKARFPIAANPLEPSWLLAGRLWSLVELMQKFEAPAFAALIGQLQRAGLLLASAENPRFGIDPEDKKTIAGVLEKAKPYLAELPLSQVVIRQFERLAKQVPSAPPDVLAALIVEMTNNLLVELAEARFLMIPAGDREFWEQRSPPFGAEVGECFKAANKDIAAASRCAALNEWTASVFHLMRVLEHGLRALAEDVGLGADAMSHENWKNVIDQIEAKIREIENLKKSSEKIARSKELSGLATQFRYFKEAWRNHVSHAHESYDQREAANVWRHVKSFMQQMVPISSSGKQP